MKRVLLILIIIMTLLNCRKNQIEKKTINLNDKIRTPDISSPQKITMVFGDYPPYYIGGILDENTQITKGMFVEFLYEFEKQFDYEIIKICVPRKRIDLMMETGKAQVFSLTNPLFLGSEAEKYLFTEPIFYTKDVVVSLKENPLNYEKPEDLFGKKIGKVSGMRYGELDQYFANGKITPVDVTNEMALPEMLKRKRIDAYLGNSTVSPYKYKLENYDYSHLYFAEKPLIEFALMCQINKGETQFLKDMNDFIRTSKSNSFLQGLVDKYTKH
ncbi:MAG: transporter substrate-binding domain-containing protein [Spirochaetes bacterium]|nr:transporter substrate-binding domain-containing protein [Spirochaetota bacterium]